MFLIIFGAKYLYVVVGLVAIIVFFLSSNQIRNKFLVLSAVVFPIGYLLAKLLGYFIQSPRPFVTEHLAPLIHASSDNGFPSDHTLLAMAIASIIFAYNRKVGSVLVVLALFVGVSRVLANVHSPIDVIGSITIAIGVTYVSYKFIVEKLEKKLERLFRH